MYVTEHWSVLKLGKKRPRNRHYYVGFSWSYWHFVIIIHHRHFFTILYLSNCSSNNRYVYLCVPKNLFTTFLNSKFGPQTYYPPEVWIIWVKKKIFYRIVKIIHSELTHLSIRILMTMLVWAFFIVLFPQFLFSLTHNWLLERSKNHRKKDHSVLLIKLYWA